MEPKRAWGVFSIVVVLIDAVFASAMIDLGYEMVLVGAVALVVLLVYFYVLYKRFHVEVLPEDDIMLLQDSNDLRTLCSIYGLSTQGDEQEIRSRLKTFSNSQGDRAFVWVAPKIVQSVGSVLEIPQNHAIGRRLPSKSLQDRPTVLSETVPGMSECPVCSARAQRKASVCDECGADLALYSALGESKVGRRVLSEKAGDVRRKPRYQVPSLREER